MTRTITQHEDKFIHIKKEYGYLIIGLVTIFLYIILSITIWNSSIATQLHNIISPYIINIILVFAPINIILQLIIYNLHKQCFGVTNELLDISISFMMFFNIVIIITSIIYLIIHI
jgi:hypothetical protein